MCNLLYTRIIWKAKYFHTPLIPLFIESSKSWISFNFPLILHSRIYISLSDRLHHQFSYFWRKFFYTRFYSFIF